MNTRMEWDMEDAEIAIGDWVRPAESSVVMAGQVVEFVSDTHAVVEWQKGMRSTHRRLALELVMKKAADVRQRLLRSGSR